MTIAITEVQTKTQTTVQCYICGGIGTHGGIYPWSCGACNGSKKLILNQQYCDMCGSTGNDLSISFAGCSNCTGSGKVQVDKFGKIHYLGGV